MTNNKSQITNAIEAIKANMPDVIYKLNEPMKKYSSFKIGGMVRIMVFPGDVISLMDVCNLLNGYDITPLIIGNGSNLLVSDEFHEIVMINTSKLNNISIVNNLPAASRKYCGINVDAGALLSKVALFAYENGLTGFEFALGIPGTLGGAIVMNAGAYGNEMKDVVYSTTAFNCKDGMFTLTTEGNGFSYRQSRFTRTEDVVLSSVLRLQAGDKASIKQKMDDLGARRRESQPLDLPSGGSTFKRPGAGYAAALIEQAGLKGFSIGGAQVSEKHCGFIVNNGDATFKDVIDVIEHVQDVVFEQLGIQLEPEIKIVR